MDKIKKHTEAAEEVSSDKRDKLLITQVLEALARTIDAKDKYTNGHSERVAIYSRMIARKLGFSDDEQDDIYYMGLLHDIGKIGVPHDLISKTSGLTDEEYLIMKNHPIVGYDILSEISTMPELAMAARWHHEYYNGEGYPDGIAGEDIPFFVRIIAVADSYDAMASNRSYRQYLPQDVIRAEMLKNSGTQFDPKVVQAMIEIMDIDVKYSLHE
ncbi:MAG: HD-GYP domain-containing protein [Ruminiclostridium sp.]|nr:HD-GYP domain-containing protein [Ruminiclostridium sp.]